MSRLFLTKKEIDYISDLNKEIIKDIIGQKVYWYPINIDKSNVHSLYNEAPEKIFENPIELDCLVKYLPEEVRANEYGPEEFSTIEVFVQPRDLIDKEIELFEGDFFSFGTIFFEAVSVVTDDIIYGQVEHDTGLKIIGKEARKNQFLSKLFGPTDERFSDPDAVQETFHQQRGHAMNEEGETGDLRELQKSEVLEAPIEQTAEVSPKGSTGKTKSSFYGDTD